MINHQGFPSALQMDNLTLPQHSACLWVLCLCWEHLMVAPSCRQLKKEEFLLGAMGCG